MEAIHGREAAITKDGRGRRRALALAVFTAGLLALSAGSASAATGTCPTGAASIKPTGYTLGVAPFTRSVADMTGNVNQGDTVVASVTINAYCKNGVDVSLVSYLAPSGTWDPNTANSQQVYAIAGNQTAHLGPGPHPNALQVQVPAGCFQIDLIQGEAISQFDPPHGVTYSAQKRLVDADNGDPGCVALV
jgi:hypothetical protein